VRRLKRTIVTFLTLFLTGIFLHVGCSIGYAKNENEAEDYQLLKEIIVTEFSGQAAHEWGEVVSGVKTRLKTDEKIIALGLDTCGVQGEGSSARWTKFFESQKIPVTVFACGEWIDKNRAILKSIAANPLFEIANQGLQFKPCSVNGKSVAGLQGTRNVEEVFVEIEKNARTIESITGILPQFYRSGGGYYDEVAVRIAKALGYEAVGNYVHLPAAKIPDKKQIMDVLKNPAIGTIAVFQESVFQGRAAEGLVEAVRRLRIQGYKFVKLSDYPLE